MQFTKVLVAIAALAVSGFAQDIDWTSPATLACAKANWAAIKAKSDPLLPTAGAILTPAQASLLSSLLSGQSTLPANPSDDFIRALPNAIPPAVLNTISGDVIKACLATYVPPAASTTAAPAPTTAAPAPTSAAPAPTSAAPAPTSAAPAPSSTPVKCIPRK